MKNRHPLTIFRHYINKLLEPLFNVQIVEITKDGVIIGVGIRRKL